MKDEDKNTCEVKKTPLPPAQSLRSRQTLAKTTVTYKSCVIVKQRRRNLWAEDEISDDGCLCS